MAESIVCTLSPDRAADRLAEFETLFAQALTGVARDPLRFTFAAAHEARVRDLFARERECCAFLDFTITRTGEALVVEVTAPAEAGPVLDALWELAR